MTSASPGGIIYADGGNLAVPSEGMAMPFIKGIGPLELVIILVIVMIIFGVGRLTEIGGALGKSIREFRRASTDDVSDDSSESKDKPKQETT